MVEIWFCKKCYYKFTVQSDGLPEAECPSCNRAVTRQESEDALQRVLAHHKN